ncbi:vWA domain-containing protein [Roseixanthobacter glucoisosaccharinicivorans]|uniref:vWA domain-containing protein n=1 Tax=Roseixanthobacter glucoisosaccharinicivorans TaxID=3119923 RepID=UPI003728BB32
MSGAAPAAGSEGRLSHNIAYFGRALRAAGLPVGPGTVLDAVRAVGVAGVGAREDFYNVLRAVFVSRHEHQEIFDQAFELFWRRRAQSERLIAMLSPPAPGAEAKDKPKVRKRVEDALFAGVGREHRTKKSEIEVEAHFSASSTDVLRTKDFAQMTAEELALARRRIARLRLPDNEIATRRLKADRKGTTLDLRASLRASLASGGAFMALRRRGPQARPRPVVALVDISGSMADYSRPVLHFLHALTERRGRVHTFLFGTRLTNVTRVLRHRDPDEALEKAGQAARDWSGGTRIAASLRAFNKIWSRRVMGQNPIVLLITDGLERDADAMLDVEMDRLRRSGHRLIWLNPLLRYDRFEPKARGIRAMLPHVDAFRPVHNLASLESLVTALAEETDALARRPHARGVLPHASSAMAGG